MPDAHFRKSDRFFVFGVTYAHNLAGLPDPAVAFLDATGQRGKAYLEQGLTFKELVRTPVELYTLSPSNGHLFYNYGARPKEAQISKDDVVYHALYFMSESVVRIAAETGVYLSNLLCEITRDELPPERGTILAPGATVIERAEDLDDIHQAV